MTTTENKPMSFSVTAGERALIATIATRAVKMADEDGFKYLKMDAIMDLTACHANGNPLKLAELAKADDSTFGHDVYGIRRFLDRRTGQLKDCFSPRTSAPAKS